MASQILRSLDCALVQGITNFNGHWLSSAYTLFQTGVVHKETTNPIYSQHALKIQTIFNLIDIGSVLWTLKSLSDELIKRYQFNIADHKLFYGARALGASVLFLTTISLLTISLNKYFQPYKDPKKLLNDLRNVQYDEISIKFDRPYSQLISQSLYLSRIILNIASICFLNHRTLALCCMAAQTYSLVKLSQLKWLNLTRIFEYLPRVFAEPLITKPSISKIEVSYHCLLTPILNQAGVGDCDICKKDKPTSYFCSMHPFHDACLAQSIYTKSAYFADQCSISKTMSIDQRNGFRSYSYWVSLPQKNLPECPLQCDDRYPQHGYFEMKVFDRDHGNFNAVINITKQSFQPQPTLPLFMEGLNLAHNIFQAGLASFQNLHPELSGRILQAQRWMIITNTIALIRDSTKLYDHYKKRSKNHLENVTHAVFAISLTSGILAIGLRKKPSFDLKSLIKPELLKNVNVFWSTPGLHKLSQYLSGARIAINLFSAFLSSKDEQKLHLTAAGLQALTLYNISQLPWLKFERTFYKPNGSIWASRGDQDALSKLTLDSHFLPQESLSKENFPSVFQSVYEYCNNYFKGSTGWRSYWSITKTNNVVTRTFMYDVNVSPTPIVGPSTPYIDQITAWATHLWHGQAIINLKSAT